jgi:hypothetical protein
MRPEVALEATFEKFDESLLPLKVSSDITGANLTIFKKKLFSNSNSQDKSCPEIFSGVYPAKSSFIVIY